MLLKSYIRKMDISPRIKPLKGEVYRIQKGLEIEGKSYEETSRLSNEVAKLLKRFPFGTPIKFIVICRKATVEMPEYHDPLKTEFWKQYKTFLDRRVQMFQRERFLITEEEGSRITKEMRELLEIEAVADKDRKELNTALSYFFGGNEQDPFWYPIEGWEYGVKIGDRWGVVLMDLEVPNEIPPFLMDILNYINHEYIYVSNFKIPNPIEIEGTLSAMRTLIEKQAHSPSMREVLEEIMEIQKELELGRERLVLATNTLTIFESDPDRALESAEAVQRFLIKNGLKFEIEGTVEYEAFMQFFEWDEKFCKGANLVRKYVSGAFSQMLPLTTLFKGADRGMFFLNAGGEPCFVDLYHTMPPNMIELGQMGAGKSVLGMYLGLSSDLITFVEKIQEGAGSYSTFTKYFGGEYYPISLDRPLSLNPFGDTIYTIDVISLLETLGYDYRELEESDLVVFRDIVHHEFFYQQPQELTKEEILKVLRKYEGTDFLQYLVESGRWEKKVWRVRYDIDRDKLSFIRTVLSLMLDLGGVEVDPAEVEEIAVATYKKVVEKTGKFYSDKEIVMSDFYRTAQSMRKSKLATRFLTYTMQGSFGNFFDRPSDVKFSPTIFYEIRTNEEELLPLVVMSILTNTVKFYSKPRYAKMRKGILLDEAWLFINHPLIVKWLEEGIRTYRKKGIFIALGSQLAKDFTSGAGAFLRDNSPYKFFLFSQEHTKIQEAFELNDVEVEVLRSIRRPKDYGYKYAKYYIHTPYGKGTVYFMPSRLFYWLGTTDPADRIKREEYRKKVLQMYDDPEKKKNALYEAIKLLAQEEES